MGTRKTRDLPARLEGVRRRFERWRRTRKVRSRIPEPLWASAVKMAGTYGIHRTAKALRLNYYALKKRVTEEGVAVHRCAGKGCQGNLSGIACFRADRPPANAPWSWRTPAGRRCGSI